LPRKSPVRHIFEPQTLLQPYKLCGFLLELSFDFGPAYSSSIVRPCEFYQLLGP
jgi:hypothetical protein